MRLERLAGRYTPINFTVPQIRPAFEQAVAEADALRDSVYDALSSLPIEQRSDFNSRLFRELGNTGLNVPACLLILGVSSTKPEELTAPETASLIRYVRLNNPKAMMPVGEWVKDILAAAALQAYSLQTPQSSLSLDTN